jgi:hypothetical protein
MGDNACSADILGGMADTSSPTHYTASYGFDHGDPCNDHGEATGGADEDEAELIGVEEIGRARTHLHEVKARYVKVYAIV